ncbi:helix-turn-helix domain-containing protein [Pasteurella multocida]|uniref:helix-turn-helix domain-containing protein n=1 Tax=Pasteurella multocida TaxID=747 RepID=UPI00287A1E43|nr:helix-turn-helix domain-containing protein [Pasteurella multocida]HDX1086946.1 helix-turn-helix domain-containing protein [Pasteurella multocida]
MSMILTAKALNMRVGNPLRKLVLVKLADNANDDGICFPSVKYIADVCEISETSVKDHIKALIEMGLVTKKARKTDKGNTSNLYVLHLEQSIKKDGANADVGRQMPEGGSGADGGVGRELTTEPITLLTNQLTKKTKQKKSSKSELEILADFGITGQLANDFIILRKAKKAPITETVLSVIASSAEKINLSLADAIRICIVRNWQGFNHKWVKESDLKAHSRVANFQDNGEWSKDAVIVQDGDGKVRVVDRDCEVVL